MLVLTRHEGEKICIGDNIVVEVIRYNADRVRLGISAPKNEVIVRSELNELPEEDANETDAGILLDSIIPKTLIPHC